MRSGSGRVNERNPKQTDLRLRLETWAVSVTFLVLMAVTVSQAMAVWQ